MIAVLLAVVIGAAPSTQRLSCTVKVLRAPDGKTITPEHVLLGEVIRGVSSLIGLAPLAIGEMELESPDGLAAQLRACGTDVNCFGVRLGERQVQLGLDISADFSSEPPLVAWTLIDAPARKVIAADAAEVPAAQIISEVPARAKELLVKAGFVEGGRVRVTVEPNDALVTVDGPDPSIRAGLFELRPGWYRFRAAREGFEPATRELVVRAGVTSELHLVLEEAKTESIFSSPWLYIAGGAALVIAASAVAYAVANPSIGEPIPGSDGMTFRALSP